MLLLNQQIRKYYKIIDEEEVVLIMFDNLKRNKKKNTNPIRGFNYTSFIGTNNDLFDFTEDEIVKYLLNKGMEELKSGKIKFHSDFMPYSSQKYLESFPDLKEAIGEGKFESPFHHFQLFGYDEIIHGQRKWEKDINTVEVEEYYLIPEILREKTYLSFLASLDISQYLKNNIDIASAINSKTLESVDIHFRYLGLDELFHGTRILLKGVARYDEKEYLKYNSNLKEQFNEKDFISGFEHFLLYGYHEILRGKREYIKEVFSSNSEKFLIEDILRESSYLHFLSKLDIVEYFKKNTDLILAIESGKISNLDAHFREKGLYELYLGERVLMEGLAPYDDAIYLNLNQDVEKEYGKEGFVSAFEHYLLFGYKEVLNNFRHMSYTIEDTKFDVLAINKMIIEKSGLFNYEFYVSKYPDVFKIDIDPLTHFILFGAKELRDPNNNFNIGYYLSQYPDVKISGLNPLVHYILVGQGEDRETSSKDNRTDKIELLRLPLVLKPVENITLKLAVVIHAFYIDVLEDIITSIDKIYPQPDLFISVSEDADIQEIKDFLVTKGYKNSTIKAVQNRGRDVAPFLVEFAEALKSYDLCCKIHGKKSLYGGSEQTNWRNHLYHNLLGSKEIVDDILSAFYENEKLGLLFSDNYGMIPYWGYTWLTNKGVVNGLLKRLHLQQLSPILEQTYIDYPAGTMFWFRPQAISQILDSGIGYNDFPEEPIGNDGTIAHGLERLFGYVTRLNGYDYIEQNRKLMQYTKNVTHKNFNQHQAKTLKMAKDIVLEKECIIFDIFDTLVTRTIFYPDNLFRIIEQKFDEKFSVKSDFMKIRKETEYQLRISEEHTGDVSYEDIYNNLHLNSDYTPEMVKYLRTMDFDYEMEILIPKPDAIELLKYAYNKNIDTLFVSDMYLTKAQVMSILKKHDIPFKEQNVLVSSDTGYRKDNTSVWKHLVDTKRIDPVKTLMIGDSEVSDAKLPGDFAIGTFHVLSEKNAFFESPFGKAFTQEFGNASEKEMLLMGPVVNHIFTSAFELSETVLDFSKKCTPYSFGYTALGPLFYLFINNIYQLFSDKKIFFLARDGYFIQNSFEHFLQSKDLKLKGEAQYLQISRRAMLGAVLKNEENLKNMILDLGNYNGMFSSLIYSRVGLDAIFLSESKIEDFKIKDQHGLEKAYSLLLEHIELINEHSKQENEAYMHYLESIGFFEESEDVLIDLGYSGTIQNYLHQLTKKKLIGEYFVTTQKVTRVEGKNNVLNGYFADKIDPSDNMNTVYKYALILEAFLTSDKGQLICYTEEEGKIIPQYKEKTESIEIQSKMMDGIRDYISALSIVPSNFIDTENERLKAISLFTYKYMIQNRLLDEELMSIFHLEDEFTGNPALDIMTILTERGI